MPKNAYSTVYREYSLVPISESGSCQWPLLPLLLPDIVFLGHRGINNLLLCKMHISFCFHSTFGSVSGFHNISLRSDPISESKDHFRITSSEMAFAVSAWVTKDRVLQNDHK